MSISEKLETIAENEQKVFHAGQLNVISSAECLSGSASGSGFGLFDVSPVEHTMGVTVSRKNLWPYSHPGDSQIGGVTFTDNGDGTFTASGTPEGGSASYSLGGATLEKGTYTLSGCPAGGHTEGGSTTLYLIQLTTPEPAQYVDFGDGITFTLDSDTPCYLGIIIVTTVDNLTFSPQIEKGSTATSYSPYISDLSSVNVKTLGKNLFSYPYYDGSKTSGGITFTDNGDGTITANGTATANVQFYISHPNKKTYIGKGKKADLSGCPTGGGGSTYMLQCVEIGASTYPTDSGKGNRFTTTTDYLYAYIYIKSGTTVDNLVFKPQIALSASATEYEQPKTAITYQPTADGTVDGVTRIYPSTTIMTDTDGALIECHYYKDIDTAFNAR